MAEMHVGVLTASEFGSSWLTVSVVRFKIFRGGLLATSASVDESEAATKVPLAVRTLQSQARANYELTDAAEQASESVVAGRHK